MRSMPWPRARQWARWWSKSADAFVAADFIRSYEDKKAPRERGFCMGDIGAGGPPHPSPLPEGEGTVRRKAKLRSSPDILCPQESANLPGGSNQPPLPPGEGWGEGTESPCTTGAAPSPGFASKLAPTGRARLRSALRRSELAREQPTTPKTQEYSALNCSRSTFFCTLPITLRGRASTTTTRLGCLKRASLPSSAARISASLGV